jgi:hypothetical protein
VVGATGAEGETSEQSLATGRQLAAQGIAGDACAARNRGACVTHEMRDSLAEGVALVEAGDGRAYQPFPSKYNSGEGFVTFVQANDHFVNRHVAGTPARDWQRKWFDRQWNNARTQPSKAVRHRVPLTLNLREGQEVMNQRNIDLKRKLVNGSVATIEKFIFADAPLTGAPAEC